MTLYDSLSKIAERVQSQRHLMQSEAATKQVSIRPFIEALGYDMHNLAEVQPEYSADAKATGGDKVDYAFMRADKPIILIEAKTANTALNDKHWKQLHHYFVALDAELGILTNGIEYRFYTDLKKPNIMDQEPFLVLDILNLDERLVKELEPLTRKGFAPERIRDSAKIQRIVNLLQQEMNSPSDVIVKHFAGQIYSGILNPPIIQDFRPLVRAAFNRFVEQKSCSNRHQGDSLESISTPLSIRDDANDNEHTDEPIAHENVLIPVYANHEGEDITAQFKVKRWYTKGDKVILYEGVWDNVTGWATKLKKKIHAKRNIDKSWQTKGWTAFWYYKDAKGKAARLDDFRNDPKLVDRYLRNRQQ